MRQITDEDRNEDVGPAGTKEAHVLISAAQGAAAPGDFTNRMLARPQALRPLVDKVNEYNDWAANQRGTSEQLAGVVVAEAKRLLDGPELPEMHRAPTARVSLTMREGVITSPVRPRPS